MICCGAGEVFILPATEALYRLNRRLGETLDDATRHELLETVCDESERMTRLIENLLQMILYQKTFVEGPPFFLHFANWG